MVSFFSPLVAAHSADELPIYDTTLRNLGRDMKNHSCKFRCTPFAQSSVVRALSSHFNAGLRSRNLSDSSQILSNTSVNSCPEARRIKRTFGWAAANFTDWATGTRGSESP